MFLTVQLVDSKSVTTLCSVDSYHQLRLYSPWGCCGEKEYHWWIFYFLQIIALLLTELEHY